MACMSKHHKELVGGVGKCSVPMWSGGVPAGFCDAPAYGKPPPVKMYRSSQGERVREDGRYNGYVPALACQDHGGPSLKEVSHQGDPCKFCGLPHDDVPIGPCVGRIQPERTEEEKSDR